jgi:hypothetical protein
MSRTKSQTEPADEKGEAEWKQTFNDWKQELVAEDRILTESQIKVELL